MIYGLRQMCEDVVERPAVLFVCLGNICRSPLAEAAFRAEAERAGLGVRIDSAGTGGWHAGDPPDPRAVAEARRHGLDISAYAARKVQREDFYAFTYILALDQQNLKDLSALRPKDATAVLCLLMDFAEGPRRGKPVADPYYGGPRDFTTTWADVSAAAKGLAQRLLTSS